MDLIPYRACHIDTKSRSMLFAASAFNGIFRMDFDTGEIRNIGIIPDEEIFQGSLYGRTVVWGKWLVLLPLAARELAILDRETGRCVRKIRLPGYEENKWKFAAAAVCGNDMILIPARYPYFLSLKMTDFSVTVLQDWKKYLEKECSLYNQQQLTVFTVGRQGDLLYLQVMDTDCLLRFDMEKKEITKAWHLPEMSGIFALCDEKNIYVVPGKSGQILCMNARDGKIERGWPMPVTINEHIKGHVSVHGRMIGKKLVLFPQLVSRIGVIDLETGEAGSYVGCWSSEKTGKPKNVFQTIEMLDERYAIALVCYGVNEDYECFLIDTCDFSETSLKMRMPLDWWDFVEMAMGQCIERKEMLEERKLSIFGCEDIVSAFCAGLEGQVADRRQLENNNIGERIYRSLREDGGLC